MAMLALRAFATESDPVVRPELHGHFLEHLSQAVYEGVWHDDSLRSFTVDRLRELGVPVLRWPGGCFADVYDWRDGIGPREARPRRVANRWGPDEVESNAFGTHEFMAFCEAIDAVPWFTGNVGTGDARLMTDWVEYCLFRGETTWTRQRAANGHPEPFAVPYWGIGNEPWDCGGKFTPTEYAETYCRFESALPRYEGTELKLIAAGSDGGNVAERADWTREVLGRLHSWRKPRLWGYDVHYYTWGDLDATGESDDFSDDHWWELIRRARAVEPMLLEQRRILDSFDPKIELILGEWGIWHPDRWNDRLFLQKQTMRDAVVTALQLDLFQGMADKLAMANLAQLTNVLHAPIQTFRDQAWLTPTYAVFALYRDHRGGRRMSLPPLPSNVSASATAHPDRIVMSLTNLDPNHERRVEIEQPAVSTQARQMHHDDLRAYATFESAHEFQPKPVEVEPAGTDRWRVQLPAGSVTTVTFGR